MLGEYWVYALAAINSTIVGVLLYTREGPIQFGIWWLEQDLPWPLCLVIELFAGSQTKSLAMAQIENYHATQLSAAVGRHRHRMDGDFDASDYSVVVKHRGRLPSPWRWEIYCAGKRRPLEQSPTLFASRETASIAGKLALARLIEHVSK
jgi:hypothetical protein